MKNAPTAPDEVAHPIWPVGLSAGFEVVGVVAFSTSSVVQRVVGQGDLGAVFVLPALGCLAGVLAGTLVSLTVLVLARAGFGAAARGAFVALLAGLAAFPPLVPVGAFVMRMAS